jgi:hypothetical protein
VAESPLNTHTGLEVCASLPTTAHTGSLTRAHAHAQAPGVLTLAVVASPPTASTTIARWVDHVLMVASRGCVDSPSGRVSCGWDLAARALNASDCVQCVDYEAAVDVALRSNCE